VLVSILNPPTPLFQEGILLIFIESLSDFFSGIAFVRLLTFIKSHHCKELFSDNKIELL
jgi:hypothetical protein